MNELIIKLGALIRSTRKEKQYSTQEFANKLNVSSGLINNIENAKSDTFNLILLENISSLLNVDILNFLLLTMHSTSNLNSSDFDINKKYNNLSSKLNYILLSNDSNSKTVSKLLDKLLIEINYFESLDVNNK